MLRKHVHSPSEALKPDPHRVDSTDPGTHDRRWPRRRQRAAMISVVPVPIAREDALSACLYWISQPKSGMPLGVPSRYPVPVAVLDPSITKR